MRKFIDIINERICQTPGAIYHTTITGHTVKVEVTLPDQVEVGDMTDKQGDKFDDMIHDAMEKIVVKIVDTTQPDAYDRWKLAREKDPVKESRELSPAEAFIDQFDEAQEQSPAHAFAKINLWPQGPREVELSHIHTEREARGKGHASALMELLVGLADENDITLKLGIATDADGRHDSLTRDQLHDWYTSWGFEGGTSMVRRPE